MEDMELDYDFGKLEEAQEEHSLELYFVDKGTEEESILVEGCEDLVEK